MTGPAAHKRLSWTIVALAVACGSVTEDADPSDASSDPASHDVVVEAGGQSPATPAPDSSASGRRGQSGEPGADASGASAGGAAGSAASPVVGGAAGLDPVDSGTAGGSAGSGDADASETGSCESDAGECVPRYCAGHVLDCGDCLDNDADGRIDLNDPECTSPCQDTEEFTYVKRAGMDCSLCRADCFFDEDCLLGNDACFGNSQCDPLTPDPACPYDPNASTPGTLRSCGELSVSQSAFCHEICDPLVPNGCDCFGCCEVPGSATPVWLGSRIDGLGTCTMTSLNDPARCRPCTISPGCFNPCERCEICIGKPDIPSDCGAEQQCAGAGRACGRSCQPPCAAGEYCRSGCCTKSPG